MNKEQFLKVWAPARLFSEATRVKFDFALEQLLKAELARFRDDIRTADFQAEGTKSLDELLEAVKS